MRTDIRCLQQGETRRLQTGLNIDGEEDEKAS